jgi:hypothetical protein
MRPTPVHCNRALAPWRSSPGKHPSRRALGASGRKRAPGDVAQVRSAAADTVVEVVVPLPLGCVLVGALVVVVEDDDDDVLVPPEPPDPLALDLAFAFGAVVVVVPVDVPGGGVPRICDACCISCSMAAMSA